MDNKAEKRFMAKVRPNKKGCWIWTGGLGRNSNGKFWLEGEKRLAHRVAYEHWVGEIPEGLVLDHFVCNNPRCVNPEHVRPVTQRENLLRGKTVAAKHLSKTHCINGHEFTPENTRYTKKAYTSSAGGVATSGARKCRKCDAERARKYRASTE